MKAMAGCVLAGVFLTGCSMTFIEKLNVATNAGVGCVVARGSDAQQEGSGGGEVSADAVTRAATAQGQGAGMIARAMSSTIDCTGAKDAAVKSPDPGRGSEFAPRPN